MSRTHRACAAILQERKGSAPSRPQFSSVACWREQFGGAPEPVSSSSPRVLLYLLLASQKSDILVCRVNSKSAAAGAHLSTSFLAGRLHCVMCLLWLAATHISSRPAEASCAMRSDTSDVERLRALSTGIRNRGSPGLGAGKTRERGGLCCQRWELQPGQQCMIAGLWELLP